MTWGRRAARGPKNHRGFAFMNIRTYLTRRLIGAVPLLAAVSVLSFAIIQLSPSDPAEVALRVNDITPTPEAVAEMRERLGLDRPPWERYWSWLANVLRGDLGASYVNGKPVVEELRQALPPSAMLAATATAVMLAGGLSTALLGAFRPGSPGDRIARLLLFLASAMPSFWLGLLLIWGLSVTLDLFPVGGMNGPASLVLPALTLALPHMSAYARLLRAAMLRTRQENFVLYDMGRGLPARLVMGHIFRNSLQTCLTALGMSLPRLMAGAFVVETVFAWPGLGRLCVTAVFNRDFPIIQAYVLLMAGMFVICNLCVDVCAALLDPRLREGGAR